jgi:hypothetical protein
MADRILIAWERHEKYRLAMTPADAEEQFGTTDPAEIRALLLGDGIHIDDLEDQYAPDGEGTRSVTTARSVAYERDEGLWWRAEGSTPGEHAGPFPSPDAAFTYWQEHG